jgi:DNA-binding response OmpR family regulator
MAEPNGLRVLLIEDDAPRMRTMAWALTDDGFEVQVVSKRQALEVHGLEGCDVAVFNMTATASEKTAYNNQLRMLNPDCVIIDVDEFIGNGGSKRDSGADSYTARPLNLDDLVATIREMTSKPLAERQELRDATEERLHGTPEPDHASQEDASPASD